jgi:hypothetical protein
MIDSDRLWTVMNDIEESVSRLHTVKDLLTVAIRRNTNEFENVCYLTTALDLIDDIEDDCLERFNSAFEVVMNAGATLDATHQQETVGVDEGNLADPYSLDEETYNQMVSEYERNVVSFG